MLEKDSLSQTRNVAFISASDSDPMKEASSLASDNTMPSTHGLKSNDADNVVDNNSFVYQLGEINHTSSEPNFFGNDENKDSNDFLYYGWPEIGNFEDMDGMFRSCNSTFDLGLFSKDELGWSSSADDLGRSGDVLKLNVKFPCPEPDVVKTISENHDLSKGYSINDSAMTSASIRYKDTSWTSENSDSCMSFATGPDSYNYLQNPISYVISDNCRTHLSDPATVNLKPSTVKSESTDLTSISTRDSYNAPSQLQYMESSHDLAFEMGTQEVGEQREKLHSCEGKFENHEDPGGVSLATPAELGSSNVQESATMSSGLDDISLEAASFRRLQLVMERLDLRMKLCIRDSLYRLAQSAEQRHSHANLNVGCGNERDATCGTSITEGTNTCTSFMDMETDTNPVDRSIAHLLFYSHSHTPPAPSHDSFAFKSPSVVHGSVASPPVLAENSVSDEETVSEAEKEGL